MSISNEVLEVTYRKISELKPAEYNPRGITKAEREHITESIQKFGVVDPIIVNQHPDRLDVVVGGHQRLKVLKSLKMKEAPCVYVHLTYDQERELNIRLNKNTGHWEFHSLGKFFETGELIDWGFSESDFPSGFDLPDKPEIEQDDFDEDPDLIVTDIQYGDEICIGPHRLMCGDSTNEEMVARLMAGQLATMIQADPPYGMGKESDGVMNDNIYNEKLDAFQMEWWRAFRKHTIENGSVYIWGNAPDLWRLWYRHLEGTEALELRNQIVWDKKTIPGMKSALMTQYPITTEHCLFIQIGKQFIGNLNTEDYPEEYEPIRSYLANEADAVGLKPKDVKRICNCHMYSHWFTKSQFSLISRKHYEMLQKEFPEAFLRPWSELKKQWDHVKGKGIERKATLLTGMRSYFDNSHEIMRDVWEYPRVIGEERFGHATPKPVPMIARSIYSSSRPDDIVAEPFGGTGTTMVAAQNTGRRCFMMELSPIYCQIIVNRMRSLYPDLKVKRNGKVWN